MHVGGLNYDGNHIASSQAVAGQSGRHAVDFLDLGGSSSVAATGQGEHEARNAGRYLPPYQDDDPAVGRAYQNQCDGGRQSGVHVDAFGHHASDALLVRTVSHFILPLIGLLLTSSNSNSGLSLYAVPGVRCPLHSEPNRASVLDLSRLC